MPRRIIDLSTYLENDVPSDPPGFQPQIEYIDHHASVPGLTAFFRGLEAEDIASGTAWASEGVEQRTRNVTPPHPPYPYTPTMDPGRCATSIPERLCDCCTPSRAQPN